MACSSYILFASIWIATDNGAFLFYELAVAAAALGGTFTVAAIAIGAALPFWRQMYLPVAGIFGLSWLLRDRRLNSLPIPLLAAVVPCAVIAAYFVAWHGLTPPGFQGFNGFGFHTGTPLSVLGLIALFAPFYFGYLRSSLLLLSTQKTLVFGILCAAGILWLMGPTNHSVEDGRWGGLIWTLAEHTPLIGSRSPLVLCLALVGGLIVSGWIAEALARREMPYEVLTLALYLIGYSLQIEAFQRYVEAPILFTYGFAATRAIPARYAHIGPSLLAAALGCASVMRIFGIAPRMLT
jgi:hypothetical protein